MFELERGASVHEPPGLQSVPQLEQPPPARARPHEQALGRVGRLAGPAHPLVLGMELLLAPPPSGPKPALLPVILATPERLGKHHPRLAPSPLQIPKHPGPEPGLGAGPQEHAQPGELRGGWIAAPPSIPAQPALI